MRARLRRRAATRAGAAQAASGMPWRGRSSPAGCILYTRLDLRNALKPSGGRVHAYRIIVWFFVCYLDFQRNRIVNAT